MRETQIYEYFAFGFNYHLLGRADAGVKAGTLKADIDEFLRKLLELDLKVTLGVAKPLIELRQEIEALDPATPLSGAVTKRVSEALDGLDATLDVELGLRTAYVVTPKRYAVDKLLSDPASLLGANVFSSLPGICQFDFAEGCKCIAFGRPTAAGFHFMRCVEGSLRAYYCGIVKRGRAKKLLWFPMTEHLAARRDSPPRALIDNLDSIRKNFRNPTQHPDARYDIDEAQDLLAVSIDALGRLARDTTSRS